MSEKESTETPDPLPDDQIIVRWERDGLVRLSLSALMNGRARYPLEIPMMESFYKQSANPTRADGDMSVTCTITALKTIAR
jgi:hypothetical protein